MEFKKLLERLQNQQLARAAMHKQRASTWSAPSLAALWMGPCGRRGLNEGIRKASESGAKAHALHVLAR